MISELSDDFQNPAFPSHALGYPWPISQVFRRKKRHPPVLRICFLLSILSLGICTECQVRRHRWVQVMHLILMQPMLTSLPSTSFFIWEEIPVRYKAKFFWRRCVDCVSPAPQVRSVLMRTATVLAPINSLTCRARAAQGRLSQPPTALSLRISNFSISWCGRMVQWGCCPLQNCMRVTPVSTRKGSPDNARNVQGACSASGGLLLCLRPVREVRLLLTLEWWIVLPVLEVALPWTQAHWNAFLARLALRGRRKVWRHAPGAAQVSTCHQLGALNVCLVERCRWLHRLVPQARLTAAVRSIPSCAGSEVAYRVPAGCIALKVWVLLNSRVVSGQTQMFPNATSLSCAAEISLSALPEC